MRRFQLTVILFAAATSLFVGPDLGMLMMSLSSSRPSPSYPCRGVVADGGLFSAPGKRAVGKRLGEAAS
jgi:hypothetical protein